MLSLQIDDASVFSLLWMAPDGQVWAGAQSGYDANATTQLYRFDGKSWAKQGSATERLMALTGVDAANVWAATSTELLRSDGKGFVRTYVAPAGEFRACAFAAADRGYCVGTAGLAVVWDGLTWRPMTGAPWSGDAEVFGVCRRQVFDVPPPPPRPYVTEHRVQSRTCGGCGTVTEATYSL